MDQLPYMQASLLTYMLVTTVRAQLLVRFTDPSCLIGRRMHAGFQAEDNVKEAVADLLSIQLRCCEVRSPNCD
jgi:hypothetical protein